MADIDLDPDSTAVLITDPQKDFLSPDGVAWEKVGDTVEQNHVVEKLERLRDTARTSDIPVFYSPHYFNDDEFESWQNLNPIDELMFDLRMFDVEREGSDFHPDLEPDDNTFVLSPHKQHSGFWANDVQIQLRQRGIDTIVLAGMSANLCMESHLRDAVENGFEVMAVTDATAAAGEDALEAALTNFGFIAHETAETDDVVERFRAASTATTAESDAVETDGGTDGSDESSESDGLLDRLR